MTYLCQESSQRKQCEYLTGYCFKLMIVEKNISIHYYEVS